MQSLNINCNVFQGYGKFKATVPTEALTRAWTVVNEQPVRANLGLCHVDFRFDHESQYPEPTGSCHVL